MGCSNVLSFESPFTFSFFTKTTLCIPLDDGFQIYSSTQYASLTQAAVANVLGIPTNTVNVSVKRVGGAYGAKSTPSSWIASATALAASAVRR